MRSAPIRLTKFESALLLEYLRDDINECLDKINQNGSDKNVYEFRIASLYDLKKKLMNAYEKCEYGKAYSRGE